MTQAQSFRAHTPGGFKFLFVCLHVHLSVFLSVTEGTCHIRVMSQWQPLILEKCHSGNLWDRKPELWCHATAGEGSLCNKNTHLVCWVKKLCMTQAQSFRAHTAGGFKFVMSPPGWFKKVSSIILSCAMPWLVAPGTN